MSSGMLVPVDHTQLPSTQIGNDDDYTRLAKGSDFLGRLQLCTKGGFIDRGLIKPGNYGIPVSAEEIEDLGDSVDIVPFARRPKAIDMSDKEAIVTSYDMNSPTFKAIEEKSQEKESGCQFGPSFLVFERTTGRFLEFFCGSKSTRNEAKKLYPFLPLAAADIRRMEDMGKDVAGLEPHGPLPVTLKSRLVRKASYSWHVPVVNKCSTPFDNLPDIDAIRDEIVRFLEVKDDGVERVTEPDGRKSRAR